MSAFAQMGPVRQCRPKFIERPLLLQLQAWCCVAANWRFGPKGDMGESRDTSKLPVKRCVMSYPALTPRDRNTDPERPSRGHIEYPIGRLAADTPCRVARCAQSRAGHGGGPAGRTLRAMLLDRHPRWP